MILNVYFYSISPLFAFIGICFKSSWKKVTVTGVGIVGIFVPLRRLFLKYKKVGVMGIEWESA